MKLDKSFYLRDDVVLIANDLLGKYLFTNIGGVITGGIITETEAYAGITDKASHAYNNKKTQRTEIMFHEGGIAYVYLCYGMYSLFNVVTNVDGIPHAVLIRGIKPVEGLEEIKNRVKQNDFDKYRLNGPGKLTKALGIHYSYTGTDLNGATIWLEDRNYYVDKNNIIITKRVGVAYAKEDALLPYRFILDIK
ncbi:MAG: DNA-3-methyladenine glycosylase [Bacteroidota bacterium]